MSFHVSELGEAKNSDKILVLPAMERFGETNITEHFIRLFVA